MSGPSDAPVHLFDSLEEGKDTLTIHYRTEDGTRYAFTVGKEGHEYQMIGYFQGGRDYDGAPDVQIGVFLLKQGEEGKRIFEDLKASHLFAVALPVDAAREVSRKLSSFLSAKKNKFYPKSEAAIA